MMTRRETLAAGGLVLAGLAAPRRRGAAPIVEIAMRSDPSGAEVWFDPIGLHIEPGQTVRRVAAENVHTTTAYHPANGGRPLRIPEGAAPWDSGYLVTPGGRFEVTLTLEGVYDYFCLPHEAAGMVGRLVVGRPGGPGARPFGDSDGRPGAEPWRPVPEAARRAFPAVDLITSRKVVRRG